MAEINPEEFELDMKEFETRMKVLRAEFNQYLVGNLQTPPSFTEARIRKLVRKYATTRGLKGVQRFQYFNLVAKFNTMMEFYNRRIRDKQQGRRKTYGYIDSEHPDMPPTSEKPSQAHFSTGKGDRLPSHVIADVNRQSTTIKALYDNWMTMQSKSENLPQEINFDRFKSMIQTKTSQLREKMGCKAIQYQVTFEKGKAKIKAKAIK